MALDQVTNFARDELSASVGASDNTLTLSDASDFPPVTEGYNIVVWNVEDHPRPDQDADAEIVRVTSVDGDELMVERAQEGTDAASHPANAAVADTLTAKVIEDIDAELAGKLAEGDAAGDIEGEDIEPSSVSGDSVSMESEVVVDGPNADFGLEYLGVYQSESDLPDGNNPALAYVVDENEFATRGI